MMSKLPKFSEEKATEAAILLLKMHGGRMKYIRLLKLFYFIDKVAFATLGRAITNDSYCSMTHGQVPSRAFDLVKGTAYQPEGIWKHFISPPDNFYVGLENTKDSVNALSDSEDEIIRAVATKYMDVSDFDLAKLTKSSEYVKPEGITKVIDTPIEKILKDLEYNDKEIEGIKETLTEEAEIMAFFGK
jgi:hypothetical protein